MNMHVRWMIRRDMPEVLKIEYENFDCPWTEEDFLKCLRKRNCIGMVVERENKVVGFMLYELHKNQLEVLNLAVKQDCHRQGIGSLMIDKLASKLSIERRTKIALLVRDSNLGAQLFFRAMGFRAVEVLRNFYEECHDDAYSMVYEMTPDITDLVFDINKGVLHG